MGHALVSTKSSSQNHDEAEEYPFFSFPISVICFPLFPKPHNFSVEEHSWIKAHWTKYDDLNFDFNHEIIMLNKQDYSLNNSNKHLQLVKNNDIDSCLFSK